MRFILIKKEESNSLSSFLFAPPQVKGVLRACPCGSVLFARFFCPGYRSVSYRPGPALRSTR